jgi:hypothetical protein
VKDASFPTSYGGWSSRSSPRAGRGRRAAVHWSMIAERWKASCSCYAWALAGRTRFVDGIDHLLTVDGPTCPKDGLWLEDDLIRVPELPSPNP